MGICKFLWCDFVFFIRRGIIIDRINFDGDMFFDIV